MPATIVIAIIIAGIKLNIYQQNQYRRGKLHWDRMTKESGGRCGRSTD